MGQRVRVVHQFDSISKSDGDIGPERLRELPTREFKGMKK